MSEHAKLSASGSKIWLNCAGSVKAQAGFPNTTNKYAEEGTLAHKVAEAKLTGKPLPKDIEISEEMHGYVDAYVDYVEDILNDIRKSQFFIEQKVDYSHIAHNGFGTADVIIDDYYANIIHIIDLKYGMVREVAENNSQLVLYALGAVKFLKYDLEESSTIKMHIIQPRINNYDVWEINYNELLEWGEYIKPRAVAALAPDAPRTPMEIACRYCKANATCPALGNLTKEVLNLMTKDKITLEESKYILDNSKLISNFLNKVEEDVYNRLIGGNEFPGYKLVNGRNMRKINQEKEGFLIEILGEKAYNKTLLGIGQLEKMVDAETLNEVIYTTTSSPVLAKETDKRTAINLDELKFDPVED